jgi:DNA-binding transcriptional regulator YiaG
MESDKRSFSQANRVCEIVPDITAEEIRALRESLGMTRWEFSIQVGIPVNTITAWELGRRNPSHGARALLNRVQKEQQQIAQTAAMEAA